MAERHIAAQNRLRPSFDRQDTVLSDDGERYEVLPLPSPGMEEPESPTYPEFRISSGYKPRIPYMSIYSSPSRLFVDMSAGFLSKTPITLQITEATKDTTLRHPLNPYLYTIEVEHGQFKWTIYKRFKHLRELHEKLWAHRTSLKIPLPSKRHQLRRKSMKEECKEAPKIPRFPKRPDMWVSSELIGRRQKQLETYLNSMLATPLYKKLTVTKKFLEISKFSFIQDLGDKGKEGTLRKRSGGHKINLYFCEKCCNMRCRELCVRWNNRWFVVKDTFIMYLEPDQQKIKGVFLFDQQLNVWKKEKSKQIKITNSSRKLTLNCWTDRQAGVWKTAIEETAEKYAKDFIKNNKHMSFAPQRTAYAHWFVDGSSYFSAVADAIEQAQEEIFITDWWLSPQIYLKRPMTHGDKWQLDKLLKRKADSGVKIYILLYKEVEMAVALQSSYTKQTLQALNPKNIRVLRHPDHITTTADSLLWAHHEKIVVIDQTIAFIGGIDLCYGRWDNHEHLLTDIGSLTAADEPDAGEVSTLEQKKAATSPLSNMTSALLMCQAMTVAVVEEVTKEEDDQIDGGDIELQLSKLSTSSDEADGQDQDDALVDGGRGGVEQNGKKKSDSKKQKKERNSLLFGKDQGTSQAGETYKDMIETMKMVGQDKLWVGKDYCNFIAKDLAKLDDPYDDMIDRFTMPRMPWHDIACVTYGKTARDAARHFIQRWNFTKLEKAKTGETVPFLVPKAYSEDTFYLKQNQILPDAVNAKVQVLRSSAAWSAGISKTEHSIQNAYIDAINRAEHFIYIENQFFISVRDNSDIYNKIVDALYHRIIRAHAEKKNFRVFVVMPLIPGFEGDISDSGKSLAIQAVMYWQYHSTNRGEGSLIGDLSKKVGLNATNYISFCGLRTHSELQGKPITEIIYVHSKMLIVDDRIVIIGSANINDRSMTGERDSEVALMVEDTQMIDSTMDEKPCKVGKFASRLRKRVFAEHLGLLPDEFNESVDFRPTRDIDDVVCDKFFKDVWLQTAGVNTTIYEKVFRCVPSDFVKKFSDIADFQSRQMTDGEVMRKELKKVRGYLVFLPLFFLMDEVLRPEGLNKENMAPTALWT